MANFIKFRYTLDPTDQNYLDGFRSKYVQNFISDYEKILSPVTCVWGYETKNKLGEATAAHIHCHFTTDKEIETIRKALTRKWKDEGETRTRASLYSLKLEKDVKDTDFFFRYPLKQGDSLLEKYNVYPDGFEFEKQKLIAMEMYKTSVEVNRNKLETQLDKTTTFDKLCDYLALQEISNKHDVLKYTLLFYKTNKMSMNIKTMSGYALTYCCINNYISDQLIIESMEKSML